MQALESACQKVVENAEANCEGCRAQAIVDGRRGDRPEILRVHHTQHTCHATIDAAAEFGKAAVTAVGHNPRYPLTEQGIEDSLAGKHDEQTCSACRVEATINRLREEAKK